MSCLSKYIGLLSITVGLLVGCDSREKSFDDAPSASAPTKSAAKQEPNVQRTDKPTSGEMPADHPPVGSQGSGGSTGQGDLPPAPGGAKKRDGSTGPLRWEAPDGWKAVKPGSQMRYAEYVIKGASKPLSATIFYFGPNGGGSVQQNIDRWTGQFDNSSGSEPRVAKRTVNGMTVHTVDASGTYDAGAAMGGSGPKKGQRLLGAIIEAPTGNYFVKLIGPQSAVSQQRDEFDAFISSFEAAR